MTAVPWVERCDVGREVAVRMNLVARLALAVPLAVLAVLLGCTVPSSQAPAEDAAAPSATGTRAPTTFTRLGYRLSVPDNWFAQEGYLDWESVGSVPHIGTPAFDTMSPPAGSDGWIIIGKRPVRDSAPLDQWIDQMRDAQAITYEPEECAPVEDQRATTLGREPAAMLAFHCPEGGSEAVGVQVLARHRDAGWVVMCYSEEVAGLPEAESQCENWLSSYEFSP